MKIKIHSSELNRMLKTVVQCIDTKIQTKNSNINIIHDNNLLAIRATNGTFSAVMTAPLMGGTGESFYVDGAMFARVCAMCSGEIEISTDEKTCTVKGAGRTRIPIVNTDLPNFERVDGHSIEIPAEEFSRCYNSVAYAVSSDQGRLILTGVLMVTDGRKLSMVALDGFQMAIEQFLCYEDGIKAAVPGSFMKLISSSISNGEKLKLTFGEHRIQASTDGMLISCGLLAGEYVDYSRILPESFKTECMVKVSALKDALKSGSVVNTKNNLVKLKIDGDKLFVMSNSEEADYEAEIDCETHGDGLTIAFNQKYLMNTINSISGDEAVMKFNSSVNPCVVQARDEDGIHLILPVRTQG